MPFVNHAGIAVTHRFRDTIRDADLPRLAVTAEVFRVLDVAEFFPNVNGSRFFAAAAVTAECTSCGAFH